MVDRENQIYRIAEYFLTLTLYDVQLKNGLHLNLMRRNMDMSNVVEMQRSFYSMFAMMEWS